MKLQTFRTPFPAVLTVKCSFVARVPLLEFRTPILCFLYALLLMIRIPFLFVVLALVPLQILFPTLPRLLKSPLRSRIISTSAVSLVLCFPDRHYVPLLISVILLGKGSESSDASRTSRENINRCVIIRV